MTRLLTYSLRAGEHNSNGYYRTIAAFADEWLASALHSVGEEVAAFRAFRREAGLPDRSDAECAFELLALGVLLRDHGGEAARLPSWAARLMNSLVEAQSRWPRFEEELKRVRGWGGWLAAKVSAHAVRKNGADVRRLVAWLRANGENGKARRFEQWRDYMEELGTHPARRVVAGALALAAEFDVMSDLALGRYTENVPRFLADIARGAEGRYDCELVSRSRLEYHLGMLGTEILSRAYRRRFLAAEKKIIIVPPCMRAQPEEECKAVETPFGAKCQACTTSCRVHQVTMLGEKHGVEVFMIPDELRVFGAGAAGGGVGVVGVACALTNWGGGWDADSLGVPAQGVLLDYVGCKYHWDPRGFPTDVNVRQVWKVMGKDER